MIFSTFLFSSMILPPYFIDRLRNKCDRSFLRFIVPVHIQQHFLYRFDIKKTSQFSLTRHRDGTCFFRNDQNESIGVLRDPDAGAMPRSQVFTDALVVCQRQNAASRISTILPDDQSAIVKRCSFIKDITQKLIGYFCIDHPYCSCIQVLCMNLNYMRRYKLYNC